MSLIHRRGRVGPSPVQPGCSCSCPSALTPSPPHYLPPLTLSLSFLSFFSPRICISFALFLFDPLGRAAKVEQVRSGRPRQLTSGSTRNQRHCPRPSREVTNRIKNARPIGGQRYVRAAPRCFFVHRPPSLVVVLDAHSSIHPRTRCLLSPLPLCIVISHAVVEAALAGADSHLP